MNHIGGSVGTLDRHPAGIGRHQITRAHCRVAIDVDGRDAEAVPAVAGAVGHDARAVRERVLERAVAAAVAGDGAADVAAREHLGRGCRAERVAELGRGGGVVALDREVPAVAQPHAVSDGPAGRRRRERGPSTRGRPRGIGKAHRLRRNGITLRAAEQAEQALRGRLAGQADHENNGQSSCERPGVPDTACGKRAVLMHDHPHQPTIGRSEGKNGSFQRPGAPSQLLAVRA